MFGAYRVYLILKVVTALAFAVGFTITAIYRVRVAGLDPLQLVLVGTVLEASFFVFEVPTGVVADTYSRRLSIIVGVVLLALSFFIEGLFPVFAVILLAQIVAGLGYTFTSGATEAWIADEVGEARAGGAFLRGAQLGLAGEVVGTLLSVALASTRLNVPILLAGALMAALGLFLIATMPETAFRPTPRADRGSWARLAGTLHDGLSAVRGRPLLLTILGITAFWGASSEGFDRLWEAHFLANFTLPGLGGFDAVVWFGILRVGSLLLGIGATELIQRRLDTNHSAGLARLLASLTALLVLSVIGFGLAGEFGLAVLAYWLASAARHVSAPLFTTWINQQIEPSVRATVLSDTNQADAFGQIAGGPVIGAVGSLASLRASLVVAGALLTPALPLFARAVASATQAAATEADG